MIDVNQMLQTISKRVLAETVKHWVSIASEKNVEHELRFNECSDERLQTFLTHQSFEDDGDFVEEETLRGFLVGLLTNETALQVMYNKLSTYEKTVLNYFVFHVGQDILTFREIESGDRNGIGLTAFRLGLTGLRQKGLVYTLRRQWGEVAYVLPSEIGTSVYASIMAEKGYENYVEQSVVDNADEIIKQSVLEPSPVLTDLYFMLDSWRQHKALTLPLTRKGSVHKRYIRQWEELIVNRNQAFDWLKISFQHRDTYTKQVAIYLDFITRQQLIEWYEDSIRLNIQKVTEWMQQSRNEMMKQFLMYWFKNMHASSLWVSRYIQDMSIVLEEESGKIGTEPSGSGNGSFKWHYSLAFVEVWEDEYSLPPVDDIYRQLEGEVFQPLVALGCIEVAETTVGEKVWRFRTFEEQNVQGWLQPNHELFVPEIVPFKDVWRLTQCFQLKQWEQMLVFQLDVQRVQTFIEEGHSMNEWVQYVQTVSAVPLPESFIEQMKKHQSDQQRIFASDVTLLELQDVELANAMQQWHELKQLNVQRLTSQLIAVPLAQKEVLLKAIQKKGFSIQEQQSVSNDNQQPSHKEVKQTVISYRQDKLANAKVENVYPELSDAIPAWEKVPSMWKKQFISYHEQTKRDIVKQAIENELLLKVENCSGEVIQVKPIDSYVQNGDWLCIDQHNKQYHLSEWNRIQLLFPLSPEA